MNPPPKTSPSQAQEEARSHYNAGELQAAEGRYDEAVQSYQKAIALKPDMAEAYNSLGAALSEQKKFDAAMEMYRQAISLKADYTLPRFNLGNLLRALGRTDEAIEWYAKAIVIDPNFTEAYINMGVLLKQRGMLNEALMVYEHIQVLQPENAERLAELVHYLYEACAWDKIAGYERRLLDMVRQGYGKISPFALLGTAATAEEQLRCTRSFNPQKPQFQFTHKPQKRGDRIKIGYLSADLHMHATALLMAELFECHDRARFDIAAYSYGPDDNSDMRKRLVKAFDSFVDLRDLSDRSAAQKIYDDGVDILIDLKGYTTDNRMGIPACRPAPIQVNYIGYPGSMGVDYIDYIIADRFIIPEDQERFYSEKVACLPDCYQPNDTQRKVAETPTRQSCGLPAEGFVFCCFNANYKITPAIFDIWMRLLQKVPGSVLWLLERNTSVRENLKREAGLRGIDPARIIYAPKMPPAEHLARQKLADLFLDTLPVNAHTTASDALWAGLPVLTCVGSTFAGRVAGSLLKAAGLPELITYSLADYEALALRLAQHPAQLAEIRQKLERTRLQMPLFDIKKFTRNIEKSYQAMWDIWQSGGQPRSFTIDEEKGL